MRRPGFRFRDIPLNTREGKLTVMALVIIFYTIALFLSVAWHEIAGHGLTSILLGGDFFAVYVSPGSGYASVNIEHLSAVSKATIYLAGITVEIIGGLVLLYLVLPRVKNFLLGLFGLVLSVVMLTNPSIYLFLGYFISDGDSFRAAYYLNVLGTETGEFFIVTGLILVGIFVLLISMAALKFLGQYIDAGENGEEFKLLGLFWFPPIILGAVSALAAAVVLSGDELIYSLANASVLLLFIGVAIFLVPHIIDLPEFKKQALGFKSMVSVLLCFFIVISVWIGAFGVTESSAHGMLLSQPPLEVENAYSDFTIGNLDLMVYENGTTTVSIRLRNILDNTSSPLDRKIYHSFDERPDWEYYIERTRYMLIRMFDLSAEEGENLSFSSNFDVVRYLGEEIEHGRVCSTNFSFEFKETVLAAGVRQGGIGGGNGFIYHPGESSGDKLTIRFADPWATGGGYLDEVRISWEQNLTLTYTARNSQESHILYNRGSLTNNSIGWKNINYASSPTNYEFILRRAQEI
jgi:hypothetical protein